ncbi:MAG: substrate-binding domain-containing protein [Lachnospiraceae bacterium]|nr:substrate-binding domain-containing protein [Lachnospiraceae bacterium]
MITNKRVWIGFVAALLLVLAWASYRFFHVRDIGDIQSIPVILSKTSNDPYMLYRRGLEQAAKDYRMKLSFVYADNKLSALKRALKKETAGIILEPDLDKKLPQMMEEHAMTTRFMLLDSDVEPEGIFPLTAADNRRISVSLMDLIQSDFGEQNLSLDGKRVGLVYFNGKELAVQQRRDKFVNQMDKMGMLLAIEIRSQSRMEDKLRSMFSFGGLDLLVALDNPSTEACAHLLNATQPEEIVPLYGEGYSEAVVYFLDKGVVNGLVLPNEFQIGYQAVEQLRQLTNADTRRLQTLFNADSHQPEKETIDIFKVKKENMFDSEFEKIVFPMP